MKLLTSSLFYLVTFYSLSITLAICQAQTLNLYKNNQLGIEISYKDADDFDDEITIVTPESLWVEKFIPDYKISIKLPQGFTIGKKPPEGGITYLGVVVYTPSGNEAFTIYQTNSAFYDIVDGSFGLVDTDFVTIDRVDTVAIQDAILHNRWVSFGRQGMSERATYLNGILWKGVRGSNFTGYYTDQGYSGLQRFSMSCLVWQFSNGFNLVCDYEDAQIPANPIRETDFYNIVATIKKVP